MTIVSMNGKVDELLEEISVYLDAKKTRILAEMNTIKRLISEGKKFSSLYDRTNALKYFSEEIDIFNEEIEQYRTAMRAFNDNTIVNMREKERQDVTD